MTGQGWVILMPLVLKGDAFSCKFYVVSHKENKQ